MDLILYLTIIRRRWRIVAGLPLLVGLISLAAALAQPPRYGATAHLLVTLDNPGQVDTEDALAYDLPAVVGSPLFAEDLAAALERAGIVISPAEASAALSGSNQKREVWLTAQAGDPATARAIVEAAVDLLRAGGLRYWGSAAPVPNRPGLNIAVLGPPAAAERINGARALALEVALRAAAGLAAGVTIAFSLHYLEGARRLASGA